MLLLSLMTLHLYNSDGVATRYSGCLNESCELIMNPVVGYRWEIPVVLRERQADGSVAPSKDYSVYYAHTVMAGLNSIHRPIAGYVASAGIKGIRNKVGLIHGAYVQDNAYMRQAGIDPIAAPETKGGIGLVPLVGIEHQYRLSQRWVTNTVITPAIMSFGLGLEI